MSNCQLLAAAMEEVKYPNTLKEWQQAWSKLLLAVKREPNLRVLDRRKYDKLMDLTGGNAKNAMEFFNVFNIDREPSYTVVQIAVAGDCHILSLAKDSDGQFVEFYDGHTVMRFGKTNEIDGQRYPFYQTDHVFMDYHNTTGYPRKMKVGVEDVIYCKEDGTREYFHDLKRAAKEISDFFKDIANS